MEPARQTGPSSCKQLLALDGGGVRGAISVAFIERIEAICKERSGRGEAFRLSDHFDLIGGTSTGAIIGTALALGLRASEVKDLYLRLAPRVFRRSRWRLSLVQTIFDATVLQREIAGIVGDRRLDTPDLRTHLAIVMKRMDTGAPGSSPTVRMRNSGTTRRTDRTSATNTSGWQASSVPRRQRLTSLHPKRCRSWTAAHPACS